MQGLLIPDTQATYSGGQKSPVNNCEQRLWGAEAGKDCWGAAKESDASE